MDDDIVEWYDDEKKNKNWELWTYLFDDQKIFLEMKMLAKT